MFPLTRLRSGPAGPAVPPGPKGHFLLGSLREFGRDRLEFLARCARQYGDIVRFRLGHRRAFLLNHPDHIEQVLVSQHRSFVKHSFFWRRVKAIFGSSLVSSEGAIWRRERRITQPAFQRDRIDACADTMVCQTNRMLDGWQAGEIRELHEEMVRLTLGIAAKLLFRADFSCQQVQDIQQAVGLALGEIGTRLQRPVLIPDSVPTPGNLRYRRAIRQLDGIVQGLIGKRRSVGLEGDADLLALLLGARDEHGAALPEQQIRDEVVTFLLAGHETTALLLVWAWHLLMAHPAAERRLMAECEEVLGERAAVAGDFERLTYTRQLVSEVLRLYPPAYLIGREPLEDCEIGAYRIPAGSTVFMSPWVMQRDPRYFDRPEDFLPERWADGLARQLPPFVYFPFGGGPRVCIGQRFALMEAVLVLGTMARRFRFRPVLGTVVKLSSAVTLRPVGGIRVELCDPQ